VWEIELYTKTNGRTPVLEFLEELNPKEKAKVIREIDLLAEFGPALFFPHTAKIQGDNNKDLYELRPQSGNNIFRIFYFSVPAGESVKFILVHGFRKKTGKTPDKEMATARNRRKAYLEGTDEMG